MANGKPIKESDEKRFNETLKRMLKTPPDHKAKKTKPEATVLATGKVTKKASRP